MRVKGVTLARERSLDSKLHRGRPARPGRKCSLESRVAEYLLEVKVTRSLKTFMNYKETFRGFLTAIEKDRLENVERADLVAYIVYLEHKGNSPRTIFNRLVNVQTFFNRQQILMPMRRNEFPRYTERVASCYAANEIQALLSVADMDECDILHFFLCTGARSEEVRYATWADIDWDSRVFTVQEKDQCEFRPKDREEGPIPVPEALIERLRYRRRRFPNTRFIFECKRGKASHKLLSTIKALALRAELNCGDCYSENGEACSTNAVCRRYNLVKFRRTYATLLHDGGVPVRTIQRWLRHSELETTLKYLAHSNDKAAELRLRVDGIFAGFAPPSP